VSILVVCYANQCRSPMGEALLRQHLAERGVETPVSSAGLLPGGVEAALHAREEMTRRGLDLGSHRSRQVDATIIGDADLILTMTRRQVTEIAVIAPRALPRTMTAPEALRRAQSAGKRSEGQSLAVWAARLTANRQPSDVLKAPVHDDVVDPMGGPAAGFTKTAQQLDQLFGKLVELAYPR
jgi:protein-tyrosine phosphatase